MPVTHATRIARITITYTDGLRTTLICASVPDAVAMIQRLARRADVDWVALTSHPASYARPMI